MSARGFRRNPQTGPKTDENFQSCPQAGPRGTFQKQSAKPEALQLPRARAMRGRV